MREAILKIFQIVQHFPPLLQNSGGKHCYWVDTKQPLKREQQIVRFFFRLFLCWCWWELAKIVMAQRNCQTFKFSQKQVTGGKKKIVLEYFEEFPSHPAPPNQSKPVTPRPIDGCMLHCIYSGAVKARVDCWTHLGTPPARPPRSPACTCRRTRPAGCSTPRCPHTCPPARGWCTRQYL